MIGKAEILIGRIPGAVYSPEAAARYSIDTSNISLLDTRKHLRIFPGPRINTRLKTALTSTLIELGRGREAWDVEECGSSYRIFKASSCAQYLVLPFHCNHRLCQLCARRRSQRILKDLKEQFPRMVAPKMLTLTVKNVANIDKAYFKWLRGCFTKLRRRKLWLMREDCTNCERKRCIEHRDGNCRSGCETWNKKGCKDHSARFDEIVGGGIYSIETTFNAEFQTWHVHIHALIDSAQKLPVYELRKQWEKITKGSWGVDIRQAYDPREVVKYETKSADFIASPERVQEYLEAVKGSRLYHTFGDFFDVSEEEKEEDETKPFSCACGACQWQYFAKVEKGQTFEDEAGTVWRWSTLREFVGNTS